MPFTCVHKKTWNTRKQRKSKFLLPVQISEKKKYHLLIAIPIILLYLPQIPYKRWFLIDIQPNLEDQLCGQGVMQIPKNK